MTAKELARNYKRAAKKGIVPALGPTSSYMLWNYLCGGGYQDKFDEVKAILKKSGLMKS
jgi:hypothetical protein